MISLVDTVVRAGLAKDSSEARRHIVMGRIAVFGEVTQDICLQFLREDLSSVTWVHQPNDEVAFGLTRQLRAVYANLSDEDRRLAYRSSGMRNGCMEDSTAVTPDSTNLIDFARLATAAGYTLKLEAI